MQFVFVRAYVRSIEELCPEPAVAGFAVRDSDKIYARTSRSGTAPPGDASTLGAVLDKHSTS